VSWTPLAWVTRRASADTRQRASEGLLSTSDRATPVAGAAAHPWRGRPDRGAVKTGRAGLSMPAVQASARKAWSPSAARIVPALAIRRPYGTLCSDAFGLHAYRLRPPTVDPSHERMTVLCRESND
jgi:hypothetical protein